jgi:YidC/Oxa1 family membrane protein insertase
VLLWDKWTVHTGQPSMFGGTPRPAATAPGSPPAAATAPVVGVPAPSAAVVPGAAPAAASAAAATLPAPTAAAPGTEKITLTTDVVKATFDSQGGTLVRLELLGYKDSLHRKWYEPFVELFSSNTARPELPNVVLFEQNAKRVYLAQTGLITAQPGVTLPNHLTQMTPMVSERTLKDGSNELQIRFESQAVDGLRLVKTYTLKRGDYTIGVKHEFINDSGKPVTPQLYLQLARDGNPPEGESSFYFTFTGPALYTDAGKFQKVDFSDIEKGKADHPKSADNGWVSMVQHYFASAWLLAGNEPREFRATKVSDNLYSISMVVPLGEVAAGSSKVLQSTLFAGPQEENKLAALAPGLDLVKDYGWFTILAKPLFWLLDQLHSVLGNWGWSIVALVVLLKMAFYWLNASAYRSMAKMKAVAPKVTELRERYKDKPQQMQQEMMRIYREEKVNPLGGCLLHRAVLGAAVQRGDAQRAVDPVDPRPVAARPVFHPAAADDRVDHVPDLAEPDTARSGAGEDDVDHAAGVLRDVLLLPGRPGAVLADEQHPVHRPAMVHQQEARGAGQVVPPAPRVRGMTRPA